MGQNNREAWAGEQPVKRSLAAVIRLFERVGWGADRIEETKNCDNYAAADNK
jgi:hypothetical protein